MELRQATIFAFACHSALARPIEFQNVVNGPCFPGFSLRPSASAKAYLKLGACAGLLNFVAWLEALKKVPVGIAFAVQSIAQLMVPISAWLFLHEQISSGRTLGILLVFVGVFPCGGAVGSCG